MLLVEVQLLKLIDIWVDETLNYMYFQTTQQQNPAQPRTTMPTSTDGFTLAYSL
jgi:hypothetical protein